MISLENHLTATVAPKKAALRYLKLIGAVFCLVVLASNLSSISRWSERRGVSDDLCYLRQAHLFQKFGFQGLDTNIKSEADNYFGKLVNQAGHSEWNRPDASICHSTMLATDKRVLQYPPGTGFLLAAFPEGFQVIPLYAATNLLIFLTVLVAINYAKSTVSIGATTIFGCLALYLMINPAKASYSIAPTMVVCALTGCLTAALFNSNRRPYRLTLTMLIGLLLGISVNFRIANLLLSAGYFAVFFLAFMRTRCRASLWQGVLFVLTYVIGLIPTLLANAINAGSPFSTTYGPGDTMPPVFSFGIAKEYLFDLQGGLILTGVAVVVWILTRPSSQPLSQTVTVVIGTLLVNLAFFLSHPISSQYYLMPVAMLSLWSLVFGVLMETKPNRRSNVADRQVRPSSQPHD